MIPTLPIFATVYGAYSKVFQNFGALSRATVLPVLVLLVFATVRETAPSGALVSLIFWSLNLPFVALIAVACHRVVLLGADSLNNPWSIYWTARETSFLVWLLILGIFLFVAAKILSVVFLMSPSTVFGFRTPWLGLIFTYIAVTYLGGRFSMVLPATALGKRMIMSNSWYLTAGNGPTITVALLLPLVIMWCLLTLGKLLAPFVPQSFSMVVVVILIAITFAAEVAVLSLSYQYLRDSTLNKDVA